MLCVAGSRQAYGDCRGDGFRSKHLLQQCFLVIRGYMLQPRGLQAAQTGRCHNTEVGTAPAAQVYSGSATQASPQRVLLRCSFVHVPLCCVRNSCLRKLCRHFHCGGHPPQIFFGPCVQVCSAAVSLINFTMHRDSPT